MNNSEVERIKAREKRMVEPWNVRKGYIKAGFMVHWCNNCRMKVPAGIDTCHKCGGKSFGKESPTASNHYVFTGDNGEAASVYGDKPIEIECSLIRPVHDSVVIGRDCYQGKKRFCSNFYTIHPDGTTENTETATGIEWGQIKCEPLKCPFSVGGSYGGKNIRPGQCKQSVTLFLWLPKAKGTGIYQFKSGSINTINNIQSFLPEYVVMFNSQKKKNPVQLILKIGEKHTHYPDPKTGDLKPTKVFESQLGFNFSFNEVMQRAQQGQLAEADICYVLPTPTDQLQLPEPAYDELIDGARNGSGNGNGNGKPIGIETLEGEVVHDTKQVKESASKDQIENIKQAYKIHTGDMSDGEIKKFKGSLAKRFNIPKTVKGLDLNNVERDQVEPLLSYLNMLIDNKIIEEEDDGKFL